LNSSSIRHQTTAREIAARDLQPVVGARVPSAAPASNGSTVVAFSRHGDTDYMSLEPAIRPAIEHDPVRVMVVDHDRSFQDLVATYLDEHDMLVTRVTTRGIGPELVMRRPSLMIVDLRHDQDNGLDLLRDIRLRSDVPVITTGDGCSELVRVAGFELGADDHLAKPLNLRELLARIRAILRRRSAAPQRTSTPHNYRFGEWHLNQRTRRLTGPNGDCVPLTKREYTLLVTFLNAPLRPLTREYLLQATRAHEDAFDRSIDVQILRLRRKLKINASAPCVIRTERGVGYIFSLPVALERADELQ
jgi:two-component system, OmpR family, response regulator